MQFLPPLPSQPLPPPLSPGCRKVIIEPHLGRLDFVEGTYPTPYGVIRVRHERGSDGTIHSEIHLPPGVTRLMPE